MNTVAQIDKELERIRKRNGGILQPEQVVEFAKNPKTALHSRFEWDNSLAAQQYRLWQARVIIRVRIRVEPRIGEETKTYVSLVSDRKQPGGGYRTQVDVLRDDELREELLQQALREAETFARKYAQIERLAPIFEAISKVRREVEVQREPIIATA